MNVPVRRQLATLKVCFKEASKVVLLDIQHDEENSIEAGRLAFSSMSRALWFNSVSLARKLLSSSELAKTDLCISGCKACVVNPAFFDVAFNEAHSIDYSTNIKEMRKQSSASTASANLKKPLKSRVPCSQRLRGIYWPLGKRMTVTGVKILLGDGASFIASTPWTIQAGLQDYWTPVYSEKPCDKKSAKIFLNVYAKRCGHLFDSSTLEPPPAEDYEASVKHARHSGCGEDGVPYSAYKATSFLSSKVLHNSASDLASECPESDLAAFNKQLLVCPQRCF